MFFLYFAVRYAVNEKQLAFVGVGLVLINNYQPAASLAAVGVVACTVSLNKLDSVNVHRKCVFMVVAEECGDDIARFFQLSNWDPILSGGHGPSPREPSRIAPSSAM